MQERIWVAEKPCGECGYTWVSELQRTGEPTAKAAGFTEYVRADLLEAQAAQLQEARNIIASIAAQLPAWTDAMLDWEMGGESAAHAMTEASEALEAFLAKSEAQK